MITEDPRFETYLASLRSRVFEQCLQATDEAVDEISSVSREEAFTEVVKATLEDLGQVSDGETCYFERTFGRAQAKLNGWYFDEEEGRLDLITTLYRGLELAGPVGRADLRLAVERAVRAFEKARGGYHEGMEPASPSFDMMQRFHQVQDGVSRIRVIVFVDGVSINPPEMESGLQEVELQVEIWDLRRLFRAEASGLPFEEIEIDFQERIGASLPCLPTPGDLPDHRVLLAVLPGDLLHSLYHEFGARLLELNVRSFLQARGKVNRGIRDTLLNESGRFLAYNNGISATAHEVEFDSSLNGRHAIRRIKGLQIVNGGQTVASIHRARERDGVDLGNVFVQAKITVVAPERIEELVPYISRYANTQNRVNEADFSANHPFHVKVQQLSDTVWAPGEQARWFYERARGQYEVARSKEATTPARRRKFDSAMPRRQKFDKVLLAKCVNAWDELPHIVSRGGQKNFVQFMQRLAERGDEWEPDAGYYRRLIAKLIVFKHAESLARKHKFPGYRANAVAYTVSLVSYRTAGRIDLEGVWSHQGVSDMLSETLRDWMPEVYEEIIDSAEGQNVTEWCKKSECWRHIQTLHVAVPSKLERELSEGVPLPTVGDAAGRKGAGLTTEDRQNIARVMQISAKDWIDVVGWGARSGTLQKWQLGIATTLAGYSAAGWTNVPSKKQAKHGVEILRVTDVEGGPRPAPDTG